MSLIRAVQSAQISLKAVENILHNLADYAYLGEHPLVQTRLIASRLPAGATTHLNWGKLVCQVLAKAIEKLRHTGPLPADPPPPNGILT